MDPSDTVPIIALSQPEIYHSLPIASLTAMRRVCKELSERCRELRGSVGFWITYARLHPAKHGRSYATAQTGAEVEFLYSLPSYTGSEIPLQLEWFPLPSVERLGPLLYNTHEDAQAERLHGSFISTMITHMVSDKAVIAYLGTLLQPFTYIDNVCKTLVLYASDGVYLYTRNRPKHKLRTSAVRDVLLCYGECTVSRYLHLASIDEELPAVAQMKLIVSRITTVEEGLKLVDMMKLYPLAQKISHDGDKYRHYIAGDIVTLRLIEEPSAEVVQLIIEWELMTTMASGALFLTYLLRYYSRARRYGGPYYECDKVLAMLVPLLLPIPATSRATRSNLMTLCEECNDAELLALLTYQLSKK